MSEPSPFVKAKRQRAVELGIKDKVDLIIRMLGHRTSDIEAGIERWEYLDHELDVRYMKSDWGPDWVVVDAFDRFLFSYTVSHWHHPVRAFREDPHWLRRLEVLHKQATIKHEAQQSLAYRQQRLEEKELFE